MRRENNFDVLRFTLAWTVVITHCYDLSLSPALAKLAPALQSGRAVEGFFAISGCLIVASWDRSNSMYDYLVRRAKRILPAYWLAIAFCVVLGERISRLTVRAFWRDPGTYKYILCNFALLNFIHPALPGVFDGNPANNAMDGSLWTIKIEVAFYLFVPILVWLIRRFGCAWVAGSVFVLSLAFRLSMQHLGRESLATQLPGQLAFFMVGTAVYYYFPRFLEYRRAMWGISIVLLIVAMWSGSVLVDAVATPLFVLCVAFLAPPYRGLTRYGDFSYGTYVLHYPVIQALIAVGMSLGLRGFRRVPSASLWHFCRVSPGLGSKGDSCDPPESGNRRPILP